MPRKVSMKTVRRYSRPLISKKFAGIKAHKMPASTSRLPKAVKKIARSKTINKTPIKTVAKRKMPATSSRMRQRK